MKNISLKLLMILWRGCAVYIWFRLCGIRLRLDGYVLKSIICWRKRWRLSLTSWRIWRSLWLIMKLSHSRVRFKRRLFLKCMHLWNKYSNCPKPRSKFKKSSHNTNCCSPLIISQRTQPTSSVNLFSSATQSARTPRPLPSRSWKLNQAWRRIRRRPQPA